MPKRALVAYEARRRRPALPVLRWHRVGEQVYRAEKDGKSFTVFHRSPDRRHGKLPWVLTSGGIRGTEIKSFDTAADAKEFARCYNAQPPAKVIVQAAPGMPAGTYKGTLAAEAKRTPYFDSVEQALRKMDAGGLGSESSSYVASMEAAGIDPSIVASVLVATHQHRHDHNCVGKHVELAEARETRGYISHKHEGFETIFDPNAFSGSGGWYTRIDRWGGNIGPFPSEEHATEVGRDISAMVERATAAKKSRGEIAEMVAAEAKRRGLAAEVVREDRREDHIFRGKRIILIQNEHGVWRYEIPSMGVDGVSYWIGTKDEAWAAAQRKMGMPAGFSMAVEEGREAAESKRRLPQPNPETGM